MSEKRRYIFLEQKVVPCSAGRRIWYVLRDALVQKGYDVKILSCNKDHLRADPNVYMTFDELDDDIRENDILVCCEWPLENPLGFRHVVRWLLNDPHFWGMSGIYHSGELLFAFEECFYSGIPCLRPDVVVDRNLFYDAHTQKDVNCLWVYKRGFVRKIEDVPELKGTVQITTDWPAKREELAKLLQRTDTLYSMDDNSALLLEAELCGAKVKIIEKDCIRDAEIEDVYSPELFEKQLNYFIEKTQNFRYEGPVNKKGFITERQYKRKKLHWRMNVLKYKIMYILTHSEKIKHRLKENKKKLRELPLFVGGKYVF